MLLGLFFHCIRRLIPYSQRACNVAVALSHHPVGEIRLRWIQELARLYGERRIDSLAVQDALCAHAVLKSPAWWYHAHWDDFQHGRERWRFFGPLNTVRTLSLTAICRAFENRGRVDNDVVQTLVMLLHDDMVENNYCFTHHYDAQQHGDPFRAVIAAATAVYQRLKASGHEQYYPELMERLRKVRGRYKPESKTPVTQLIDAALAQ